MSLPKCCPSRSNSYCRAWKLPLKYEAEQGVSSSGELHICFFKQYNHKASALAKMVFFVPICCQFGEGVNNPCKCKIIGPTLGFVGFVLTAIICWPAGACMYCCCRDEANNCFATPSRVNESTSMAIPF